MFLVCPRIYAARVVGEFEWDIKDQPVFFPSIITRPCGVRCKCGKNRDNQLGSVKRKLLRSSLLMIMRVRLTFLVMVGWLPYLLNWRKLAWDDSPTRRAGIPWYRTRRISSYNFSGPKCFRVLSRDSRGKWVPMYSFPKYRITDGIWPRNLTVRSRSDRIRLVGMYFCVSKPGLGVSRSLKVVLLALSYTFNKWSNRGCVVRKISIPSQSTYENMYRISKIWSKTTAPENWYARLGRPCLCRRIHWAYVGNLPLCFS